MTSQLRTDDRTTRFGHLDIRYDARVLEPRPWTTHQAAWAADLARLAPAGPVLELCAGVGHIGLLTVALGSRDIVLVDLSPVAAHFARLNAEAAGLADRVEVRESRVADALRPHERFPLVLADPPWVPTQDTGRFPDDPPLAIDGGDDGMAVAWACVEAIGAHLDDEGSALLQLGTPEQSTLLRGGLRRRTDLRLRVTEQRAYDGRGVLVHLRRPAGPQS
jgi:release factor glutamine methyltransferase